jgi:hypothetical protein
MLRQWFVLAAMMTQRSVHKYRHVGIDAALLLRIYHWATAGVWVAQADLKRLHPVDGYHAGALEYVPAVR